LRKATQRIHFTKKAIENIPAPKSGRVTFYDLMERELGLRIADNGRKSFFWFKTIQGYPTFRDLGTFPASSIDQARTQARNLTAAQEVLNRGETLKENPFERNRGELTLGVLIERYIEKRVRAKSTNPQGAENAVRWMLGKYLSHWRSRKLDQIARKEVRELHEQIGKDHGKVMADRVVQLIRRLYFWAMSNKVELWSGENPATRIEFNGYARRDRFLEPVELVRLDAALRQEPNQDIRDFVELALATGARRSNVLGALWSEIDDQHRIWTITKTKTGKPIVLPLTPRALAVLKRRAHLRDKSEWVFPSPKDKKGNPLSASGHLQEPKKPWKRLLKRAQISDFTIHDLRRTNASYQSIAGSSLQVIAKTLGHASTTSTEIYAKLNTDAARQSMLAGIRTMDAAKKRAAKLLKGATNA